MTPLSLTTKMKKDFNTCIFFNMYIYTVKRIYVIIC